MIVHVHVKTILMSKPFHVYTSTMTIKGMERAPPEEQNGANFSFVAPSSEEL